MSMPFIEMPQRDEALPSMREQPAAPGRARRLAGIARHMDEARHHVLGHADAGAAMDQTRSRACSCRRSNSRPAR